MHRKLIAVAGAVALWVPATASAHVTVHPNVIPEGAFAVLDLRVPNESDKADTTKVQVQMPAGFEFLSVAPPPGWEADVVRDGKEVSEVTFSGGRIPPGQFLEFPMSAGVPGASGDTLTFKAIQTYSDGEVVRWIGDPDSEKPASQITISDEGGLIEDSTGGSHGSSDDEETTHGGSGDAQETVQKDQTVEAGGESDDDSGDGLALVALIVGALGLLAGGAALVSTRRRA